MIEKINTSLVLLKEVEKGEPKTKIDLFEIFQWILIRVKTIMFNADGTPRRSGLVKKALLIKFALEVAAKVSAYVFKMIKENKRKAIATQDVDHEELK